MDLLVWQHQAGSSQHLPTPFRLPRFLGSEAVSHEAPMFVFRGIVSRTLMKRKHELHIGFGLSRLLWHRTKDSFKMKLYHLGVFSFTPFDFATLLANSYGLGTLELHAYQ